MHDLKLDDLLSRFLLRRHRKHINFEKIVVKTSLFTEKHPNGFSVFCITSLKDEQIWGIALVEVVRDTEESILGRCDLEVLYYESAHLVIEKSEPPPRHYSIYGMPVGSDMEEAVKLKHRQMMVSKSKLILANQ